MEFKFKHPKSGEVRSVFLTDEQIQDMLGDELGESLTCDCEPIGETNVVECNCEYYLCEFELMDREANN